MNRLSVTTFQCPEHGTRRQGQLAVVVGVRCNGCGSDMPLRDNPFEIHGTIAGPDGALRFDLCSTCAPLLGELIFKAHPPEKDGVVVETLTTRGAVCDCEPDAA